MVDLKANTQNSTACSRGLMMNKTNKNLSKKLKIYFACSIMGEQGGAEDKQLVVDVLKGLGHTVLSEIFLEQDAKFNALIKMTSQQIYEHDIQWIEEADVVVAEVSWIS